jgi:translation initiation factor 3 subunit G
MVIRTPKAVELRKNLARFGDAKLGEENVTLPSKDWIPMEHPDDQLVDAGDDPTLQTTLANFILKQQESQLLRESALEIDDDASSAPTASAEAKPGVYVAPGSKAGGTAAIMGAAQGGQDADNTIRVSNLTKAVTEDDLRDLFEPFGRIFRVSLPKTERVEGGRTIKEPKGYAYIAFTRREDAERAMERLQGHGYDHLILKLEWAKPVTRDPNAPPGGGMDSRFVSGYGKQLAQDTKEKVVFNHSAGRG